MSKIEDNKDFSESLLDKDSSLEEKMSYILKTQRKLLNDIIKLVQARAIAGKTLSPDEMTAVEEALQDIVFGDAAIELWLEKTLEKKLKQQLKVN